MINRDKKYPLLIKSKAGEEVYQRILKEDAGWEYLNFEARIMKKDGTWSGHTGNNEYGIILLEGNYKVKTDRGSWETVNGRKDVFSGIAHTLYLPRNTAFELTAVSEFLDLGYGWCETDQDHPACFKTPEETAIEIRGGDNATRQINSLLQPGFNCHRLVSVEAHTPSGNWSSFPPHKHDTRKIDAQGNVTEANLHETYFYKIDKPQGFASIGGLSRSIGGEGFRTNDIPGFKKALENAKKESRTTVIYIETVPERKMAGYGHAWWDVPIAEVSESESVGQAFENYREQKKNQRYFL